MMKRLRFVFIAILIFICPLLFATKYEMDNVTQMLIGYVDVDTQLYVEHDTVYYNVDTGINLDMNDSSNRDKFLIAPSAGELGLRIGRFTLIAQAGANVDLTITHTPLVTALGAELDYELGVSYELSSVSHQEFCDSSVNGGLDGKKIDINLRDWVNAVYIKDGGLHFRLKTPPTVSGDYTSTITFVLTSDIQG